MERSRPGERGRERPVERRRRVGLHHRRGQARGLPRSRTGRPHRPQHRRRAERAPQRPLPPPQPRQPFAEVRPLGLASLTGRLRWTQPERPLRVRRLAGEPPFLVEDRHPPQLPRVVPNHHPPPVPRPGQLRRPVPPPTQTDRPLPHGAHPLTIPVPCRCRGQEAREGEPVPLDLPLGDAPYG